MMLAKEVAQEGKCLLWKWIGMSCIFRTPVRLSAVMCSSSRVRTVACESWKPTGQLVRNMWYCIINKRKAHLNRVEEDRKRYPLTSRHVS